MADTNPMAPVNPSALIVLGVVLVGVGEAVLALADVLLLGLALVTVGGISLLIGCIAAGVELGLDRSNASRMLADAVRDGLVTKAAAPDDARRAVLGLTDDGRAMLADARAWQAERFAELVADWPVRDARRFAGYLVRLAEGTR